MSDGSNKNSAISPVIGTILLVAITIVLIAIIGAVVMGLADAEDGKKVGMNAQPDNINTSKAKLILYGGESISELTKLEMIDHDSADGEYVILWEGPAGTVNVGVPYTTLENVARPPEDMKVYDTRINVKGTFVDGREVILLVQPMTFYDVKGFDNNGLIITAPTIKSADETTVNKIITVSYTNASLPPSNLTIVYQPQGKPEDKIIIDCGPGVASTKKNSYSTPATLKQGVTYEYWGEITIDGKTYTGPITTYTIKAIGIRVPTGTFTESNIIWDMTLGYNNAPTTPTKVIFCYRQKNAEEGSEVRVDLGAGTKTTESFSSVMQITTGKQYIYWTEVTVDGEVIIGPNGELGVMNPVVNPGATTRDKITTQKLSLSYHYATSDVSRIIVHYYPEDDPTNVKSVFKDGSWPHYPPYGVESTTITGSLEIGDVDLKPGTYILQAEIVTADGSFKGNTKTLVIPAISFGKPSVTVHEDKGLNRTVTVNYKNSPSVPTKTTIKYKQMNGAEHGEIELGEGVSSSKDTTVTAKITFEAPGRFYDVWLELETPDGIFESEKLTSLSSIKE